MNSVTNTHKKARKNVGGVRPFSSRASGRHAGIAAEMRKYPDCLKAVHLKKYKNSMPQTVLIVLAPGHAKWVDFYVVSFYGKDCL